MEINEKKQIDALATDIYSMLRSDAMSRAMASMLYGEGYRKASEVAREIFEEIQAKFKELYESGTISPFQSLVRAVNETAKKYTE